ncbi:MAG: NAD(P)-dependent oxidoreductase [Phycisphaerales bacterium]|nr:NAD(P)-dependent oxidoreductase [Phycisphaerales bacterium]
MRILFTGASSFTGCWFVRALAAAGHTVVATFRQPAEAYEGVRAERVRLATGACHPVYGVSFGDEAFLQLVVSEPFDVLAHHAADVTNYKSPDFDVAAAVASNTRGLPRVLAALQARECRRVVLTGSVFEPGEGAGEYEHGVLRAFSPYGLSKGLTAEMFRYYVAVAGLRLGKFVIPNPFGPCEEPRFTAYLLRSWAAGETPAIRTPAYVRDNIHVSLLAAAYVRFVAELPTVPGFSRCAPSQYAETQGAFAQRFAAAIAPRLGLPCPLRFEQQKEFPEPRVRINTDVFATEDLHWNEDAAWDELAAWYRPRLQHTG